MSISVSDKRPRVCPSRLNRPRDWFFTAVSRYIEIFGERPLLEPDGLQWLNRDAQRFRKRAELKDYPTVKFILREFGTMDAYWAAFETWEEAQRSPYAAAMSEMINSMDLIDAMGPPVVCVVDEPVSDEPPVILEVPNEEPAPPAPSVFNTLLRNSPLPSGMPPLKARTVESQTYTDLREKINDGALFLDKRHDQLRGLVETIVGMDPATGPDRTVVAPVGSNEETILALTAELRAAREEITDLRDRLRQACAQTTNLNPYPTRLVEKLKLAAAYRHEARLLNHFVDEALDLVGDLP